MTTLVAFFTGLLSGTHFILFLKVVISEEMPPGLQELWDRWDARFGLSDRSTATFLSFVFFLLAAPFFCIPFLGWKTAEFLSAI